MWIVMVFLINIAKSFTWIKNELRIYDGFASIY